MDTATAVTKTLRQLFPKPMTLRSTINPAGELEVTIGRGARGQARALTAYVNKATGTEWELTSTVDLRGGHTTRLTYALTSELYAARHQRFLAEVPMLYRKTETERIKTDHDNQASLCRQGQRTISWDRAVTAVLKARTAEIDSMIATLRLGDRVRQADDEAGTVWIIRDHWTGNDGWVWLSVRRIGDDGKEVGSGFRARAVDLVSRATDEEHLAEVEAALRHEQGHVTAAQLDLIRARLMSRPGPGLDRAETQTQTQTQTLTGSETQVPDERPPTRPGPVPGPGPGPVAFWFKVQVRTRTGWSVVRTQTTPPIYMPTQTCLRGLAQTVLGNARQVLGLGPGETMPGVEVHAWHQSGLTETAVRPGGPLEEAGPTGRGA